ncbi:MAG: DUF2090 domain-containing protein [Bdellovibrionaceae bacterium]|nr:DUF2090 domain-containing protein [Bdellovibrionales bacterium]MCB9254634.1 DUF2090 domain-containing protein [Pseudobdellovibrionaceae bacterium]
MANERGYSKDLLILPFDHRTSFQKKMLGHGNPPTPAEVQQVADFKMMIFEGFEKAVSTGLPKEKMGILVDEQFGAAVIQKAKAFGCSVSVAAEKSGQDEFDFEYGADYAKHIESVNPDFVKVLVRYNPEDDAALNQRQSQKLATLGQYLNQKNRKFIFELLVPPTTSQLERCKGEKSVFDVEMRPKLMVQAIHELQKAKVEPDVWKLEGLDRKSDCEMVVEACREGGRDKVGVIILGRGENDAKVREWLRVGANVAGVIGFAVGRTVFQQALLDFQAKKASREEAIGRIADSYAGFCRLWLEAREG